MRKRFIIGILMFASIAYAQNCPFNFKLWTESATCYNNGKILYALTDPSGNELSGLPAGLSDVRSYYKLSETDTAHYSGHYYHGGTDTLMVDHGTYIIGVEAVYWNGSTLMKLDTHRVETIATTYVKPSVSALYTTANTAVAFGKHPTLDCANTGRVQLKIENGSFPYTVTVVNHHSGDTLRTKRFAERQYDGNVVDRYDYRDYYTIDSLPAGDWDFYVVDGCGYGLPRTGQVVEKVDFPKLDYVEVYASSGNFSDSNVVKINAVLDKDYEYYSALMPEYAQYRFVYEGFGAGEWAPFPPVLSGHRALLRDTLAGKKYCDLFDRNITLEYKRTQCGDTVISRTFQYKKPNEDYFERDYSDTQDSDFVTGNLCLDSWHWHRHFHEIYYRYQEPNWVNKGNDHSYYRHHYTHPLTWVYRDTEKDSIIKQDMVSSIRSASRLYDHEVEAIYGSFRDHTLSDPLKLPVERSLVDANGCVLYTRFDTLPYCYDVGMATASWAVKEHEGDHCCLTPSSITLYENHRSPVNPDGTTIQLISSPYGNRYNFKAVYHSDSRSWTISRNSIENTASIQGSYTGTSLTLSDYCLPSGPYTFNVMTPCDTFLYDMKYAFPTAFRTEMVEEPVFGTYQQCTDRYITYTAGAYANIARATSYETGLPLDPVVTPLPTRFQVVDGPTGGYDGTLHNVGEPIRISMPGEYVVKMAPSTSLQVCDLPALYDTIRYDGATVEFEFAYAFLCDSTSDHGTAYVKAMNGTLPYTYTLYDQPDKQGQVMATKTVNSHTETAVFPDEAMTSNGAMSIKVEDACGAYFHVNLTPKTLAETQKIWFDGGVSVMEVCEGSVVQAHALEIGSVLKYEWYNPAGEKIDTVSSPTLFIPRGSDDGWYRVHIRNTGCREKIVDSVFLQVKPSPTITLSSNAEVCPGEEALFSFKPSTPHASDSILFTLAFDNGNGVEFRDYQVLTGDSILDRYITQTSAKIYPVGVNDGTCLYTLADVTDTVFVNMRTDMADACTLLSSHDKVCYGSDAHLTAKSTMEPPYVIRWYKDYELTRLLKEDSISDAATWSYYDTLSLIQHTEVFVSVEKEGICPTVYGANAQAKNMASDTTVLACGRSYRLYDSGGATGDYAAGETTKSLFATTDGKPASIHFDDINLSSTAHLFVISGSALHPDSVLCDLTAGSPNPGLLTSRGDTLTLFFIAGNKAASGWSAVVEHAPGMAVADVWKANQVVIRDQVCQSQTNTYDDPYNVVPNVVSDHFTLSANVRQAGEYSYTRTLPASDTHGCDSTVTFILTVSPPQHYDTTIVTTNIHGGSTTWNGTTFFESGRYVHRSELPGGCDSLDILNFIVLQIDTTTNEICRRDSTRIGVSVTVPELTFSDNLVPPTVAIGDVLCDDGSILKVDFFLHSGKTAKGVVFYVDNSDFHGKAIALNDATPSSCFWSPVETSMLVHPLTTSATAFEAIQDLNGSGNTLEIKNSAEQAGSKNFQLNAPAAYYCHYYDHHSHSTGSVPLGWYMPSAGELNLVYANKELVNSTLRMLRNAGVSANVLYKEYWSSTQQNPTRAWNVQDQGAMSIANENEHLHVRAILSF